MPKLRFNEEISSLAGNVHLWTVRLEDDRSLERCRCLLSVDEAARADRFGSRELRDRFVLSRGVLRTLLGWYLSEKAAEVQFSYGPAGKPQLCGAKSALEFNIAESHGVAVYGFATGSAVGVDIERERPIEKMAQIVKQFFHVEETREFISLPERDRQKAFFACWTRKEAYIKALGGGLLVPLDGFRVSLRPGEAARLIPEADEWTLRDLNHVEGYAGAVAYHDAGRQLEVLPETVAGKLLEEFSIFGR